MDKSCQAGSMLQITTLVMFRSQSKSFIALFDFLRSVYYAPHFVCVL